jgi:hypothetical protein
VNNGLNLQLESGRLCVVGRDGDEDMFEDRGPPSTPAYLGLDADPMLDDWDVHRQKFEALEACRVGA